MIITLQINTERDGETRVLLDGVDVSAGLSAVEAHSDLKAGRVKFNYHEATKILTELPEAAIAKLQEFDALPEPTSCK